MGDFETLKGNFTSGYEEVVRRARLRRLDDILQALEEMNAREQGVIPERLRLQLVAEKIDVSEGATISQLIEMVFNTQDPYMLKERRKEERRAPGRPRRRYVPDEHLASDIAHRFYRVG